MSERSDNASESFREIIEQGPGWRAQHPDLPATLLILSRIKRALTEIDDLSPDTRDAWSDLKTAGKSYARRRALFVAAEAVGRLRRGTPSGERDNIRKALGVVVEEGTTLDKVRALRALSFIPSDDCVPILKRGMQDRSSWVQSTALSILLGMNLRQHESRKVLIDFLTDRFERQSRPEEVFSTRAQARHFYVNKGMLKGLMKVRGGQLLALYCLGLWFASALRTVVTVLRRVADVVITWLTCTTGLILNSFVRFTRAIFDTLAGVVWRPSLLLRIPIALCRGLIITLKILALLAIWPTYQILTTPFWVRQIERTFSGLQQRRTFLTLLDYVFVGLLVAAVRPRGAVSLAISLAGSWVVLVSSLIFQNESTAERFRLFSRCLGAAHLVLFLGGPLPDDRLALVLTLFAGAQGLWLVPSLVRGVPALFRLKQEREGEEATDTWLGRQVNQKLTREWLLNDGPRSLCLWICSAWKAFHPRLAWLASRVVLIGLLLVAMFSMLRLTVGTTMVTEAPAVIGRTELTPFVGFVQDVLYVAGHGAAVTLLCLLPLLVIHLVWDEFWIVEQITFRTRSKNIKRFNSDGEFLAYIFRIVRDPMLSRGLRVRAASALTQVPLVSESYVDQLEDLADEEGLPSEVVDAVSEVADEAEKRLTRRSQHTNTDFKVDMELVNRGLPDIWKPGAVWRPWIRLGLAAVLLLSLLGAAQLWPARTVTDFVSLGCFGLGFGLVMLYITKAEQERPLVRRSLLCGLVLLTSVFTRPLQSALYQPSTTESFENNAVWFAELSDWSALTIPVVIACLVARVTHTIYLLGCDADVEVTSNHIPTLLERKVARMKRQHPVLIPTLFCAFWAVLLQSHSLQQYLDQRNDPMPTFKQTRTRREIALKGVPMDGRVVRVAMVRTADNEGEGTLRDLGQEETRETTGRLIQELGLLPMDAKDVWGDVWLTTQDGALRSWSTSPVKCLQAPRIVDDIAIFDVHSRCLFSVNVRLVAVVYDRRRSEFIKALRVNRAERADIHTVFSTDQYIFLGAISPFVEIVLSPVHSRGRD